VIRPVRCIDAAQQLTLYAGPVVRVTPSELHIRDARALDTVYPAGVYLDKERWERSFGEGGVLQTQHAAVHKRRRAALNPMYVACSWRRVSSACTSRVWAL
jgi:hypothetical protein